MFGHFERYKVFEKVGHLHILKFTQLSSFPSLGYTTRHHYKNQRSGKWYLQKVNIAFFFMGFSTKIMPASATMNDHCPSEKDALAGSRERRPLNKVVAHCKFPPPPNLVHLNV